MDLELKSGRTFRKWKSYWISEVANMRSWGRLSQKPGSQVGCILHVRLLLLYKAPNKGGNYRSKL